MLIDLEGRFAIVVEDYDRPYDDPIVVKAGDIVIPDASRKTDLFGWIWCKGPDGREGWTPLAWIGQSNGTWRMTRDFNALELTLRKGERVALLYSESGFVMARAADGSAGWAPDAMLKIVE